jgi:tetratricopeptide (TPR) repeat protein
VGGTRLEARVLAWLACHALAGGLLPKEWLPGARITAIGGQTARQVDDIAAVTEAGGHLLIQSKKHLGLGSGPESPLAKAIRQVVGQYTLGLPGDAADGHLARPLDQGRDRLLVVTDDGAYESVRVGLVRAVDRLAHLPENLPLSDVSDSKSIVNARDVVLAHLRREWRALHGSAADDRVLRGMLRVLRVRVLSVDDDGRDWHRAIALLETVLADPDQAPAAWNTLVSCSLEIAEKRQWAGLDRLRGELRHNRFRLRLDFLASETVSPEITPADESAGLPGGHRTVVAFGAGVQVDKGSQQVNVYGGSVPGSRRGWQQYRENILDITPSGGLLDREAELAELSAFCSSESDYLWWQAGPWAGKSALLSWFALNPPVGIVPVCFFVTARYATQSDSSAFLASLVAQLEELCARTDWESGSEPQAAAAYGALLREAARAAWAQGRRVVLIVDGLDEDRGAGLGMRSIASLLPRRCDSGLKVVVASRPHPPVPRDVSPDHPLRSSGAVRRELSPSPHARVIRDTAEMELQSLIGGSRVQQDIIGFLSAAGGGLSVADLAELTGQVPFEIRTTLRGVSGRTFTERTARWAETGAAERVYLLAHEALQEEAVKGIGARRLHAYYRRLGAWAARYKSQDWPAGTPAYLLDGYFQNSRRAGDWARMVSCATDGLRHDRMLARSGADEAAIAEVSTAKSAVLAQDDPDLTAMLRLSLHGKELEARSALLPVELPAAWAIMGQLPRAEALARSLGAPALQGRALGQMVSELARAGQPGPASRLAASIGDIAQAAQDPEQKSRLLAEAARAFAACGDPGEAARCAAAAEAAACGITAEPGKAAALAGAAAAMAAAGQPGQAQRTARKAAAAAGEVDWMSHGTPTLAAVAAALAAAGLEQAAIVLMRLVPPSWKAAVFAEMAVAVAPGDPASAKRLASQAENAEPSPMALADASAALAAAGDLEHARETARKSMRQAQALEGGIARLLTLAKVTAALGGAGLTTEALLTADSIDDPELRSRALASTAVHLARSGDLRRAADTAARAQDAAGEDPGDALMQLIAWLIPALTRAGRTTLAARAMDAGESLATRSAGSTAARELLEAITETRTVLGDHDGAERAARALPHPDALAPALAALADASAASGRSPAAIPLADQALSQLELANTEPYHYPRRDQVLARIALAFGKSGQPGRARDLALRIWTVDWRAWFTLEMTRSVPPAGDFSFTLDWLSEIEESAATTPAQYLRDGALACIAEAKAVTGAHSDATRLAREIADPVPRSQALAGIAAELHRQGKRAEPLRLIQEAEAAAGEIGEDNDELVLALTSIAEALTCTGDSARARRAIARAMALAPSRAALAALAALAPQALAAVTSDILATIAPQPVPDAGRCEDE